MNGHEQIYREGIASAERTLGTECRDYDRVLAGTCAVLAVEGVLLTPQELSNLFHYPLATWDVRLPFERLAAALEAATSPGKPSYDEQRILDRRMEIYLPYVDESLLVDEQAIERRIADLRQRQKSMSKDVMAKISSLCSAYRSLAEVVEALLGPVESVLDARARAGDLEHAAGQMDAMMGREIARLEERIRDLPVERARSLQPLSSLRLRQSAFEGNTAPESSGYVSDHCTILRKDAIVSKGRAEKIVARVPPSHRSKQADGVVESVYGKAIKVGYDKRDRLTLLGWFEHRHSGRHTGKVFTMNTAVCVTATNDLVYFDAGKLRWIESVVRFDEIRARLSWAGFPRRYAAYEAAVLLRNGKEVGVVMALRDNGDDIPFDVTEARRIRDEQKEETTCERTSRYVRST